VVLPVLLVTLDVRVHVRAVEETGKIKAIGLPMIDGVGRFQDIDAADHFVHGAKTEFRHDFPNVLGEENEEIDHVFRSADESLAEFRVLRRHADRTGVQVTLAHHDATFGDQRRRAEAELVGAQKRSDNDVTARANAAVDLNRDSAAKIVYHQGLMGFGKTDFPRRSGMHDRGQGRGARAALETGDGHMVRMGLGHARRDRADTNFRNQLDRNIGLRIDVLQVVNQLGQILDGIDVVVRRRRDQADARRRVTHLGDVFIHLAARKLASLAGLGALSHFYLDHVGVDQVFRRHAETPGSDLFHGGSHAVAVFHDLVAFREFSALAGVGLGAKPVHGDGERRVGLVGNGAEGHRARREALDDFGSRFDVLDRNRIAALELEQSPQRLDFGLIVVDERGVVLEQTTIARAYGVLQLADDFRRPDVFLATNSVGQIAAHIQLIPENRVVAESDAVTAQGFDGDFVDADAFDLTSRSRKVLFDETRLQTNGVENLRSAIGLIGGDAHLRHHL